MTTDSGAGETATPRCVAVQERIADAFFARATVAETDRSHTAGCAACARVAREVGALGDAFAFDETPDASDALVHQTLERARREMSRRDAAHATVPEGFGREVGRLVGAALIPLPLVLAWNAAILIYGGELLAGLVPASLLQALGAAYVLSGATWLGCLYGSLPLVAHRRMHRRALEMA